MARKNRLHSLRAKLLAALLLALILGAGIAAAVRMTGDYVLRSYYMSPGAIQARIMDHLSDLRQYVAENNVASTDLDAMGRWCRERRNCQIVIYGQSTMLTADTEGASLVAYGGMVMNSMPGTVPTENSYAVNFSDGAFSVNITDRSENRLYVLLNGGSVLLACVIFLLVMLVYNQQVTNQVRSLSRRVRQVSLGDLTQKIESKSRDEIGDLAGDVDAMRLSIIDKLQREERAWRANSQLITAISHDVRTPLTTLMGYLDILAEMPELPAQDRQNYLEICRRKADNLRELTDKLFSYFLILGTPEPDAALEEFDADVLFQQLLGEFCAELRQRQFIVEESLAVTERTVKVDIQHLQRICSNLLSNVCKYAEPSQKVAVQMQAAGDLLRVAVSNSVKQDAGKAESTKIGLQTCEKLAAAMGGEFRREQRNGIFTVELFLPAKARKSAGEPDR